MRDHPKKKVVLLVEGGSLIYGKEGLVAATGMAETMFHLVYPNDDAVSVEEGVRRTLRKLNKDEEKKPVLVSKMPSFPCRPNFSGYMPMPRCEGYYWCMNGVHKRFSQGNVYRGCGEGMRFNEDLQLCQPEYTVKCAY